ncbi:MAG: hypothetical protein AAFQ74_18060 [Cyanobacteria bacterium J06623_4]
MEDDVDRQRELLALEKIRLEQEERRLALEEKQLNLLERKEQIRIEQDKQAFLREKALRKQSYYFSFLVSILVPLLVIVLAVSRLSESDDKVNLYLLGAGSGILAVSSSAWLSDQAQSRKK